MTEQLPAPLVPADCDLQDFKFIPLLITRLRRSRAWLVCKRRPELAFYMINLWTAAWHELPAASLEDDDDALADLAMCDPAKWAKIREHALRGWIKCSDGRLYHPVIAELALESWQSRIEHNWKKECDRVRKENKIREKRGEPALEMPPKPGKAVAPTSDGPKPDQNRKSTGPKPEIPPTGTGIPAENALKGQGQGQGQGDSISVSKETDAEPASLLPVSDQDRLWRDGVPYLRKRGIPDGQARGIIGRWLKGNPASAVLNAIGRAQAEQAVEPISFITACLRPGKQAAPDGGYVPMGPAGG